MTNAPDSSPLGNFYASPLGVRGRVADEQVIQLDENFELVIQGIYFEIWEEDLGAGFPFIAYQQGVTVPATAVSLDVVDYALAKFQHPYLTKNSYPYVFAVSPSAVASPLPTITNAYGPYIIPQAGGGTSVPAAVLIAQEPSNVTLPGGTVVPDSIYDLGASVPTGGPPLRLLGVGRSTYTSINGKFLADTTMASAYIGIDLSSNVSSTSGRNLICIMGMSASFTVPAGGALAGRPLIYLRAL